MHDIIWARIRRTAARGVAVLGMVALGGMLAGPAQATVLAVGQSLVSDGITFTVTSCSFGGTACGDQATFVSSGGAAPGITIAGTASSLVSDPGTNHDLTVEFSAAGTGIQGVTLGVAGSSVGLSSSASVGETVYASNGSSSLGTLSVNAGGTTTDTIAFAAQSLIFLSKDITTFAIGTGNSAIVTSVTQTLSVAAVPEPASIGLLLFGLLTLVGFRSTTVPGALRSARRRRSAIG